MDECTWMGIPKSKIYNKPGYEGFMMSVIRPNQKSQIKNLE